MPQGDERLRHVIVVMLENRSFDHLLGYLEHPAGSTFDGIRPGADTNPLDPSNPAAGVVHAEKRDRLRLRVDPDHAHVSVMAQLGLSANQDAEPTNSGFVRNYEQKATGQSPGSAKGGRLGRILNWRPPPSPLRASSLQPSGSCGASGCSWSLPPCSLSASSLWESRLLPLETAHESCGCWDPQNDSRHRPAGDIVRSLPAVVLLGFPARRGPNRQFAPRRHLRRGPSTSSLPSTGTGRSSSCWTTTGATGGSTTTGRRRSPVTPRCGREPEKLARWHEIQRLFDHIAGGNLPAYSFVEPNHGYIGRSTASTRATTSGPTPTSPGGCVHRRRLRGAARQAREEGFNVSLAASRRASKRRFLLPRPLGPRPW